MVAKRPTKKPAKKKPAAPPVYVTYREPKTQAFLLIGLVLRRTKKSMLVKPIAVQWGPRFIRVGYVTHRVKIEDATPLDALPTIEVDGPTPRR